MKYFVNKSIRYSNLIILACLLICLPGISQLNDFVCNPDTFLFKSVNKSGWIKFRDNLGTAPIDLFSKHAKAFRLPDAYSMEPINISHDSTGNIHIKFQEFYKEVMVYGGQYIIHGKNGRCVSGNGKIYTAGAIQSMTVLTTEKALQLVLSQIQASKYYWEDSIKENNLKKKRNDILATYFPKAELIYFPDNKSKQLRLTYAFYIFTFDDHLSGRYFVDSELGHLVKYSPTSLGCDATTFETTFYQTRVLRTTYDSGSYYELEDDCQSSIYGVYDVNNGYELFRAENNIWDTDDLRSAASSLWAVKKSYDAFHIHFGRDGHDNDDGNLDIYHGYEGTGLLPNHTAYNYDPNGDDEIRIGLGENLSQYSDDWNPLDLIAHEYTHGVIQYEAGLAYEHEFGALNESFADIFGQWVEEITVGGPAWKMGEARVVDGCPVPLRSFENPAGVLQLWCDTINFLQPNTYQGTYWIDQNGCSPDMNNDFCGVHTNSGVQNQMFYWLCQGGSGYNNGLSCHETLYGYPWSVEGIGIENAIEIAYYALCNYLIITSDYQDARNAWVHAAETLFGECSHEAIQTGKAWYAVGIGPPDVSDYILCDVSFGNNPSTISWPSSILTGTDCYVTITNSGNLVSFKAGEFVKLNPGFQAVTGSQFNAVTTDCEFAAY